jgi:hypothetical protein
MADSLDRLLQYWRRNKVQPAALTATKSEIKAWEMQYGVAIPDDLRNYFLRVNGVRSGESLEFDHEGISFLPLSAMVPEHAWDKNYDGRGMYVFADFLAKCQWWCVELTADCRDRTPVFVRGLELRLIASTFDQFLEQYMDGAKGIW